MSGMVSPPFAHAATSAAPPGGQAVFAADHSIIDNAIASIAPQDITNFSALCPNEQPWVRTTRRI
jgi:hypothetical protein